MVVVEDGCYVVVGVGCFDVWWIVVVGLLLVLVVVIVVSVVLDWGLLGIVGSRGLVWGIVYFVS